MSLGKQEFIALLEPLDLILVQGVTPFSELIMGGGAALRGNGEFSHCALVINKEICPDIVLDAHIPPDTLLLMDVNIAIFEETKDIESGKISFGGQIRDLDKLITEWTAHGCGIAVCKLKNNPFTNAIKCGDSDEIINIRHKMSKIYNKYLKMGEASVYELNIFALLGTIFPQVHDIRNKVNNIQLFLDEHPWVFCSELVCIIYQELGIIKTSADPETFVPVDFVDSSIMQLPPVYMAKLNQTTTSSVYTKVIEWICGGVKKKVATLDKPTYLPN